MNKRRNAFTIMFRLFKLIGSFTLVLFLAVLNGTIGNLLGTSVLVFGSLAVAKIIDASLVSLSLNVLLTLCIVSGVLKGILKYLEQYSNHFIAFKILAILRDKIFAKLRELAPANLLTKKKGSIVALVTSDIETLEVFYAHTISPIIIALLTSIISFIFVGQISNYYLALILILGYILVGVVIPTISNKVYSKKGMAYRREFSNLSASYLDYVKGKDEITLNNCDNDFKAIIDSKSRNLLNVNRKIKNRSSILLAITNLVISLTIVSSLFVGINFVKSGSISVASLLVVIVSMTASFGPVLSLAVLPQNLTQTLASGNRLIDLMEEEPITKDVSEGKNFDFENLNVNHLEFKYQNEEIIKDVSFNIKKGEIVGLCGQSGSGKSTILNLLLRFFKVDDNMILYNDIDINQINTNSLRDNVTMVSQNTYLFKDTILNNLLVAKLDATLDEVKEACKKASIDSFIESLPDGYNTLISNESENISAGEKQRLGLARAFLSNVSLILLDEPTSNVDSLNEGIILKSLKEESKDHAIILVSHRLSSLSICDRIITLENGKIAN